MWQDSSAKDEAKDDLKSEDADMENGNADFYDKSESTAKRGRKKGKTKGVKGGKVEVDSSMKDVEQYRYISTAGQRVHHYVHFVTSFLCRCSVLT